MKGRNVLIYSIVTIGIVVLIGYALWQEIARNESQIQTSISGTIKTAPSVTGGVVKTDNAYLVLFDPETLTPVAQHMINPFLPPITFSIGQSDAGPEARLKGSYRLLIFTDRDGNPNLPSPGELIGALTPPLSLGTESFTYELDRPFNSFPQELLKSSQLTDKPEDSIQGTVRISTDLLKQVSPTDKLIIMLFDPGQGRPVAFKFVESPSFPMDFQIGPSSAMGAVDFVGPYSLRILTDKDGQPFQAAEGELIGRSKNLVPLGTSNLDFVLDSHYVR
jgi:hypothetical protein